MVAKGHGLGRLQMGEARHHGPRMRFGLFGESALQIGHLAIDLVERVAHPQAHVGRDLVVARARRVQPAGSGTDPLL